MTFERFCQGSSLLHRTDPRFKIVAAIALTLVIALSESMGSAAFGLGVSLVLLAIARLDFRQVLWRLLLVNTFIAFLWVMLPFTYPGDTIWAAGPLKISREGVALAFLITVKANAVIILFISLLSTSTVADLGHALESLGVPSKLCLILLFSYRYIAVVNEEYQRLARAARFRCFRPASNMHTYRTFAHLFGMTLVKSWTRAERVGQAMRLRGFNGRFYSLYEPHATAGDFIFLGVMLAASVSIEAFELGLSRLIF